MSALDDLLNNYRRISIAGVELPQRPQLNIPSGATAADNPATNSTDMTITGAGSGFPSSPAQGDLVYYNGTAWVALAPGTSGQLLKTNGASANPSWSTFTGLPSSPVQGDIAYFDGSVWANLAPGTSGQFLKTQGASANPVWASSSSSITSGVSHETTDVALGTDPTFTNLAPSVTLTGSVFLVMANASGLASANLTPRLQVTVDGTAPGYFTFYGPGALSGAGVNQQFVSITSQSSGSHTFQMKGSCSGGTWTVHASSNPTREGAWLSVIVLAP